MPATSPNGSRYVESCTQFVSIYDRLQDLHAHFRTEALASRIIDPFTGALTALKQAAESVLPFTYRISPAAGEQLGECLATVGRGRGRSAIFDLMRAEFTPYHAGVGVVAHLVRTAPEPIRIEEGLHDR